MNSPKTPLGSTEFIALMAMCFAIVAFSIDAMLPALPEIGAKLTPDDLNKAQLVLTSFVFGMGLGTFFTGPLSDAFGRRTVIMSGFGLFIIGASLATIADSLELLLLARVLQGLGAAGPRVVAMAVVRDRYSGRQMAKVMSFVMLVFILVPAVAPSLGALIIWATNWRGVFGAFVIFALTVSAWFAFRQPETLPPEARRKLSKKFLVTGACEVLSNRVVLVTIGVQTLSFSILFGMLSSVQQIFDTSFGRGDEFPLWFGGISLIAGSASILNARLVERLGMRFLVRSAISGQIVITSIVIVLYWTETFAGWSTFPAFLIWMTAIFFSAGLTHGNLNSIAMEPMGHIAGMAASLTSAISTVLAVAIAAPIGLAFNGTPLPAYIGALCCAILGLSLMQIIRKEPPEQE